jgi:hypothetical protein
MAGSHILDAETNSHMFEGGLRLSRLLSPQLAAYFHGTAIGHTAGNRRFASASLRAGSTLRFATAGMTMYTRTQYTKKQ